MSHVCGASPRSGGTWAGITAQRDYLADMGFDAIWISPISSQTYGLS